MKIDFKAQGEYQTNCYILYGEHGELIIDPGVGAFKWVKEKVKNPKAILNTHGHFDHVWSNKELKEYFNIPIYCPQDDVFMLKNDIFKRNLPSCDADICVKPDECFHIDNTMVKFWHFPGHTPGCSAIEIEDMLFSGDFIFKRSIGRVDFPYSSPSLMKESILKIMKFDKDLKVYPGHGDFTNLKEEQSHLLAWLRFI